jgi:hypothetical protein
VNFPFADVEVDVFEDRCSLVDRQAACVVETLGDTDQAHDNRIHSLFPRSLILNFNSSER